jgi:hypothetical protein
MDVDQGSVELEQGSDEQLGEEAVTAQRAQLDVDLTQLQAEELVVTMQDPSEDEEGTQHPSPAPPDSQAHPEYDPTPPADDDYAVVD